MHNELNNIEIHTLKTAKADEYGPKKKDYFDRCCNGDTIHHERSIKTIKIVTFVWVCKQNMFSNTFRNQYTFYPYQNIAALAIWVLHLAKLQLIVQP